MTTIISNPRPSNPAAAAPEYTWPNGARSALFPAFDVDAETAWLGGSTDYTDCLVTLSYGGYEARVGVPKILELLDRHEVKATFFTPGWTVDAHTAMCESILRHGHEIAHHGYLHLRPDISSPTELVDEIDLAIEAMKSKLGTSPVGYRAPFGESTIELLELLKKRGIRYSSSWRDDIRPYRHVLPSGSGPVEIPVNYSFDDWTYGLTHRGSPRSMFKREDVLSIWQEEFDQTHEWGGVTTMVMHPQVTGRPMRINILDQFLGHVREAGDVWVARGIDICSHFEDCETQATPAR